MPPAPTTTTVAPVKRFVASIDWHSFGAEFELSEIEHLFRGRLDGLRVLEIGGGYGGMAATVAAAGKVARYSIVDLDIVGTFIAKYLDRIGVGPAELPLHLVSESNEEAVESDLLFSFFCLSEQKGPVVEGFIRNYVAHATRGLVQLNYDDEESQGAPSQAARLHDGWSVLQIFEAIYKVQPSAVLLPPAHCEGFHYNIQFGNYTSTHGHHRIRWGPDIEALPPSGNDRARRFEETEVQPTR